MRRFLPPSRVAAAEMKASHEVMELVRKDPALSLLVVRLRVAGEPWHQVKVAIEAKIKSPAAQLIGTPRKRTVSA
jgi:hypothetical protein